MDLQRTDIHPSDYGLHRWASQGQPDGGTSAHVASCEHCQARMLVMSEEQAAFLQRFPFQALEKEAEQRGRSASYRQRLSQWLLHFKTPQWATALLICVVVGVWVGKQGAPRQVQLPGAERGFTAPPDAHGQVRIRPPELRVLRRKGHQIDWVLQRGGAQIHVPEDFVYQDGDRLGIRVTASRDAYATLVILDAKGQLQQWLPRAGGAPIFVQANTPTTLPESILLQRPVTRQGLYLLLTQKPISLGALQAHLNQQRRQTSPPRIGKMTRLPIQGYQALRWISLP